MYERKTEDESERESELKEQRKERDCKKSFC